MSKLNVSSYQHFTMLAMWVYMDLCSLIFLVILLFYLLCCIVPGELFSLLICLLICLMVWPVVFHKQALMWSVYTRCMFHFQKPSSPSNGVSLWTSTCRTWFTGTWIFSCWACLHAYCHRTYINCFSEHENTLLLLKFWKLFFACSALFTLII